MDYNKARNELASSIGKILRDYFGKGPESVFISFNDAMITIYLRHFISPMEKTLIDQGKEDIVQQTRDIIMTNLIPEIKANIKFLVGMDIDEFYFDWGMHNASGIIVGLSSNKPSLEPETEYPGKIELDNEIIYISEKAQKVPEDTISFLLNDRTLVVIRKGILVRIEKELIRMGHGETLKLAKRKLEKGLLHNNRFETILQAPVLDIFVDWDFSHDKSVIVLILKPKN